MNTRKLDKATVGIIFFTIFIEICILVLELLRVPEIITGEVFFNAIPLYMITYIVLLLILFLYSILTRNVSNSRNYAKFNFMYLFISLLVALMIFEYVYVVKGLPLFFIIIVLMLEYIKLDFLIQYFINRKDKESDKSYLIYYQENSYLSKNKVLSSVSLFIVVSLVTITLATLFIGISISEYGPVTPIDTITTLPPPEANRISITGLSFIYIYIATIGLFIYNYISTRKKYVIYLLVAVFISLGLFLSETSNSIYPSIYVIANVLLISFLVIGLITTKKSFKKTIEFITTILLIIVNAVVVLKSMSLELLFITSIIFCLILIWRNKKEVANIEHYNNLNEASLFKISKK